MRTVSSADESLGTTGAGISTRRCGMLAKMAGSAAGYKLSAPGMGAMSLPVRTNINAIANVGAVKPATSHGRRRTGQCAASEAASL